MTDIVLANIDRAGDHAVVLGVVALIAAIGGLLFGLVRLVGRARERRARSRRPEA
jgi:uncharacterized integral membrane protein